MGFKSGVMVDCPLVGGLLDQFECWDICLVAEGTSPPDEVPVGMVLTEEMAEQCLKCKNHME